MEPLGQEHRQRRDDRRAERDRGGEQARERHRHVINALGLERIEQQPRQIAPDEAAQMGVVVDAGKDQAEHAEEEGVLQTCLRGKVTRECTRGAAAYRPFVS